MPQVFIRGMGLSCALGVGLADCVAGLFSSGPIKSRPIELGGFDEVIRMPYYLINLLQVLLMLGVGVWLVPLFGGDRLTLGHAPLALALMALAASFASVAWALLVANLVSTSEQATIFTGVSTLVLGALGGVMVPRFIMPITMQQLSQFSPLAWGLDGFLELFLKNGGVAEVLPHAAKLFVFGILSLLLAAQRLGRRRGV